MDDRMEQVNWIKQQVDIITYFGDGTPEELVTFWERNVITPEWFDGHDRNLLVEWVAKAIF